MQDAKEEVRARLAIEDIVGEYVELKRAGRSFKALSPFTDERTPSFIVSPEKQIWHDFSSGKGGDIFSFVMLMEGMDFRQSLEYLARKAGVELEQFAKGDGKFAKRKERAKEALKLASRFFQQHLLRDEEALSYVTKKRGLGRQIISEFSIGYAPDTPSSLVSALEKRGFNRQELQDAGLTNRFGGDLFRGRMVVALSDASGEIVGFTGRIIRDDPKAPKYLNTPQTLLFDKSRHVFGLFQAKEAIRKQDSVVIVEGNLDVVSSHQAGVKNVVATAGTAMTSQHLKALSRLAGRIRLAFDEDKAGLAATERAIGLAQEAKVELEVITLPEGAKDPDELIQQSVELWQKAIDNAVPAVEWVINQYRQREDLTTAEGKRRFTSAALKLVRTIVDAVEREHYMELIGEISDVSMQALNKKMSDDSSASPKLRPNTVVKQPASPPAVDMQEIVLGIALLAPETRRMLSVLTEDMFEGNEARQLLLFLQHYHQPIVEIIPDDLQNIDQYVKIVQLKSDARYANWENQDFQVEMGRVIKHIVIKHREIKKQQLIDQLRQAEEAGDDSLAQQLRQDINSLIKERV